MSQLKHTHSNNIGEKDSALVKEDTDGKMYFSCSDMKYQLLEKWGYQQWGPCQIWLSAAAHSKAGSVHQNVLGKRLIVKLFAGCGSSHAGMGLATSPDLLCPNGFKS